jgi:hypothetical protein
MPDDGIDLVVPNIVEFNLRQIGAHLDPYTAASFKEVGAGLADEAVFWSTAPRVLVLHPGTNLTWLHDVHAMLGMSPPPVVSPTGGGLLVHDLLGDPVALRRLRDQLDGRPHIRLLSWGATPELYQLASVVASWGGVVELDVPPPGKYWTATYLESKTSCADLVGMVPGFRIPPSFLTGTWPELVGAVDTILARAEAAIVKSPYGVGGYGAAVIRADQKDERARWREGSEDRLLGVFPMIVQEFVAHAPGLGCPAVDMLVGAAGVDEIEASVMTVDGHRFRSVKVGAGILPADVQAEVMSLGRAVGAYAYGIGFRGWLGIDCVVTVEGQLLVTELNARRTSGMHPIVLARRWGMDRTAVRCDSALSLPVRAAGWSYADLRRLLVGRWDDGARIVPTTVRCVGRHRPTVGVLTAAATPALTDEMAAEFAERVRSVSSTAIGKR